MQTVKRKRVPMPLATDVTALVIGGSNQLLSGAMEYAIVQANGSDLQSNPATLIVSALVQDVAVGAGAELRPYREADADSRPCCGNRHTTPFCPQCGKKLVDDVSPGMSLLRELRSTVSAAENSPREFFEQRRNRENWTPLSDAELGKVDRWRLTEKTNEAWANWVEKALAREAKG